IEAGHRRHVAVALHQTPAEQRRFARRGGLQGVEHGGTRYPSLQATCSPRGCASHELRWGSRPNALVPLVSSRGGANGTPRQSRPCATSPAPPSADRDLHDSSAHPLPCPTPRTYPSPRTREVKSEALRSDPPRQGGALEGSQARRLEHLTI